MTGQAGSEGGTSPSGKSLMSSYERLKSLPNVFSLNTLVRWTGWSRPTARVMVARWAAKGMIDLAGPRAGLYFNRVIDPKGEQDTAIRALMMLYPSATLCGASVLHAAGWTTQIPAALHVAVEARASYAQLHGVVLWPRPVEWFRGMKVRNGFANSRSTPDAMPTFGLRALRPEWALADLYADTSSGAWHPDPDDLDLDETQRELAGRACEVLRVEAPWLTAQPENIHAPL